MHDPLDRARTAGFPLRGIAERYVGRFGARFLLILAGLALFFFLTFTAVFLHNGRRQMEIQQAWLQESARRAAETIRSFRDEIQTEVVRLGRDHGALLAGPGPAEEKRPAVQAAFTAIGALRSLTVYDASGQRVGRWTREAGRLEEEERKGGDTAFHAFITTAERVRYSRVFVPPGFAAPSVVVQVELGDDPQAPQGTLDAEVDLTTMRSVIDSLKLGQTGYAWVTDRDGRVIAHRFLDPTRFARTRVDLNEPAEPGGRLAGRAAGVTEYRSLNGARVLRATAPLSRTDWTVVAELPTEEAYAPFRAGVYAGLTCLVALIGAMVLAGLYLSRKLFRPLKALERRAEALAAGRFDPPAPLVGADEVRELARRFNVMAASLGQRERDLHRSNAALAALDEVSTILREAAEPEAALDRVLAVAAGHTGAKSGATALWRPRTAAPELTACWPAGTNAGSFAADVSPLDRPGALAARDGGTRAEDERGRAFEVLPDARETPPAASLFVPLISHGHALGVMILRFSGPVSLGRTELDFLEGVGSQIGVAVQNAWYYDEIRESEERLSEIVQNTADVILTTSLDGRIRFINQAGERLSGVDAERFKGLYLEALVLPEDRALARRLIERAAKGEATEDELHAPGADRRVLTLWVTAKPILRAGGDVVGILGIARDVTEARRAQEHLAQLSKMESIGTLAGGIAHDFNNLLTGILGYASLLIAEMKPEDPLVEEAKNIKRAAQKAAQLTGQILTFSRRSPFKPKPVDLVDVVKEAVDLLARLLPATIRFEWRPAPGRKIVEADAVQTQQIVMNLCINARDAMPDGGALTVEVDEALLDDDFCAANPWARRGRFAVITVRDTGGGIPDDVLPHIFEPFYTTKERGRGTGLGLSMVYGIVQQHEGFIDVRSEPGVGTTFRVYLPLSHVLTLGSETGPTRVLPRGSETVLLVDDEEVVRAIASAMLSHLGYAVYTFPNGEEALAHVRRHAAEIDLVIADVVMPRLDGRSLARKIRELRPDLPVVLASGYSIQGLAEIADRDGAAAFVEKPYTLEDLAFTVRDALDGRRGNAPDAPPVV